jgi:DNA-binding NarL/FixJ family response regulator
MTRVYIANDKLEERHALRLLLVDLGLEVVGESADWSSTLAQAPASRADMLLIDWELLPRNSAIALKILRKDFLAEIVIVVISYLDARHQAALSSGANVFISKSESPERIADRLRLAAASVNSLTQAAD